MNTMLCVLNWNSFITRDQAKQYLFFPDNWYRWYIQWTVEWTWSWWYWWTSDSFAGWYVNWASINNSAMNSYFNYNRRWTWYAIRWFKNEACLPDSTWTKLL
jgi:hypothetical protein